MLICEILLFDWYFPQFYTFDMSKYGYLEACHVRIPMTPSKYYLLNTNTCSLALNFCSRDPKKVASIPQPPPPPHTHTHLPFIL